MALDFDISNFDFYGDRNGITLTSIITDPVLQDTRFFNLTINGTFTGCTVSIIDSIINGNIYDLNGYTVGKYTVEE